MLFEQAFDACPDDELGEVSHEHITGADGKNQAAHGPVQDRVSRARGMAGAGSGPAEGDSRQQSSGDEGQSREPGQFRRRAGDLQKEKGSGKTKGNEQSDGVRDGRVNEGLAGKVRPKENAEVALDGELSLEMWQDGSADTEGKASRDGEHAAATAFPIGGQGGRDGKKEERWEQPKDTAEQGKEAGAQEPEKAQAADEGQDAVADAGIAEAASRGSEGGEEEQGQHQANDRAGHAEGEEDLGDASRGGAGIDKEGIAACAGHEAGRQEEERGKAGQETDDGGFPPTGEAVPELTGFGDAATGFEKVSEGE